jgi:hypothetical protein
MDDGYQYVRKHLQKNFILLQVKFWWMDEKWRWHDIMVIVIRILYNSWKGVVVTKLQAQLQNSPFSHSAFKTT